MALSFQQSAQMSRVTRVLIGCGYIPGSAHDRVRNPEKVAGCLLPDGEKSQFLGCFGLWSTVGRGKDDGLSRGLWLRPPIERSLKGRWGFCGASLPSQWTDSKSLCGLLRPTCIRSMECGAQEEISCYCRNLYSTIERYSSGCCYSPVPAPPAAVCSPGSLLVSRGKQPLPAIVNR
jgi:hypothetical protein